MGSAVEGERLVRRVRWASAIVPALVTGTCALASTLGGCALVLGLESHDGVNDAGADARVDAGGRRGDAGLDAIHDSPVHRDSGARRDTGAPRDASRDALIGPPESGLDAPSVGDAVVSGDGAADTGLSGCTAGSQTFFSTGAVQWLSVPTGCSQLTFDVYGAGGGSESMHGEPGGAGGFASGTLRATLAVKLAVVVGGAGNASASGMAYLGGGSAPCGGSGGGLSGVFGGGAVTWSDALIIAGGGGGASSYGSGGAGGGSAGGDGLTSFGSGVGGGGTQAAGGTSGGGDGTATAGTHLRGGSGGDQCGGGGGGGYYGGGGGGAPGGIATPGGGGSGFLASGLVPPTRLALGSGAAAGTDGSVVISWQ